MTLKIALILRVDLSVCVNLVSLDYQGGAQVSEYDVTRLSTAKIPSYFLQMLTNVTSQIPVQIMWSVSTPLVATSVNSALLAMQWMTRGCAQVREILMVFQLLLYFLAKCPRVYSMERSVQQ